MSHNHCHMSADADATDVACAAATATNQHNQPIGSERASTNDNAHHASSAYGPSPIADRSVATSAESRKNVAAFGSMQGFSAPSGCDDTTPPSSGDDRAHSSTENSNNNNNNNTTNANNNGAPPSRSSDETGPPEPGSNLHVSGLPSTVDDAVLAAAFAPHGRVVSAKVMLHVETGVSRGFGFVLFPTAAEAEHARKAMQGMSIDGHGGRLQIALSMHRGENVTAESRVVYVRHVPNALVGSAELRDFMSTFGPVVKLTSHLVDRRRSQPNSLSNVTVTFDSIQAARRCVAACHGKTPLPQCNVPLLSKMEEPQTLREQRLRDQRAVQERQAAEVPVPDASMIVASVKLPRVAAESSTTTTRREPQDPKRGNRDATATSTGQPGAYSMSSDGTVSSSVKRSPAPQHHHPLPASHPPALQHHHHHHHHQQQHQQQPSAPAGFPLPYGGGFQPMPPPTAGYGYLPGMFPGMAALPNPFAAAMAQQYHPYHHGAHLPFASGGPQPQQGGGPYPPGWHYHHHYTNNANDGNSSSHPYGVYPQQLQRQQQQQAR